MAHQILVEEPVHPLLRDAILPSLAKLAAPNLLGMLAAAAVSIAETAYVGRLGREALAAAALVLPTIMLMGMMSAGAMGGGVSSALSRALGARDLPRAEAIARHAAWIGIGFGLVFLGAMSLFARPIFHALGGRDSVLDLAAGYARIAFLGAVSVWTLNMLASVLRGSGSMTAPSLTLTASALAQIAIGGVLCFGLYGAPRLEMAGVALGQVIAASTSALVLFALLHRRGARVKLRLIGPLSGARFRDILQVGLPACLSPILSVSTVLVVTAIAARFGVETLAGYGIGARLEFLLIPIAFSVGVASLPMVGMAIGARDVARARRVAWTAGAMAAIGLGSVGFIVALFPDAWGQLFTSDHAVLEATRTYLRIVGPAFVFFGLGLALYFASQGAGRVLGPLVAGAARLAVVGIGGAYLVATQAPSWMLFALIALGMITFGALTALFVARTTWRVQESPA
jgi:putative MATE family efflux protein